MDPNDFRSSATGRVIRTSTGYHAFVPGLLPRSFNYTGGVVQALSLADRKVGNLEGLCRRLPNPHLLSGAYVGREAVLSSSIEGTQSTQSDLYLFEIDPEDRILPPDIQEVHNYVSALYYALARLSTLPLSLRFLRELHERLMQGVRGSDKTPGQFRTSQNWIGGRTPNDARFVPPPVSEMNEALDDFEKFLHRENPDKIPPLIECALLHYQFEAIHPFLDGNGRLGRLLITLLTIQRGCLGQPLLYLSAYFEGNREEYYNELHNVSMTGGWDSWLLFFLKGVTEQADDAIRRAHLVLDIYDRYKHIDLPPAAQKLIEILMQNPYVTIKLAAERLQASHPTATKAVSKLEQLGVLIPATQNKKRGRLFVAKELLDAFTREMASPLSQTV
jgi:Fic family protein